MFMRANFLVCWLLMALSVRGATPEVGKDTLRKLVKLPTITFPANWQFDPERGFTLGSGEPDVLAQISALRKEMQRDNSDAERYMSIAELYSSINESTKAKHTCDRAVDLYRKQADLQPDDGIL